MSRLRGLLHSLEGPLLLAWCVTWPLVVTWAAVAGLVSLVIAAVLVAAATPLVLHAIGRRALRDERRRHHDCHRQFNQMLDRLRAYYDFRLYEATAIELETLSDALRHVPPSGLLYATRVAETIEKRVKCLRASSPDPPVMPLEVMLRSEEDAPVDEA